MTLASHCWCESLRFPSRPLWESGKLLGAPLGKSGVNWAPSPAPLREGRVEVLTSPEDIEAIMPRLTADAVKMLAQQLYDYPLSDDAAESVAHMVGAMATYSRRLESLNLSGLQPPFGYPTLIAEAERSRRAPK